MVLLSFARSSLADLAVKFEHLLFQTAGKEAFVAVLARHNDLER